MELSTCENSSPQGLAKKGKKIIDICQKIWELKSQLVKINLQKV
jgi:hypothetical protein